MAADSARMEIPRSAAFKDKALVYQACTIAYAKEFQQTSPSQLVGRTDFDFLDEHRASVLRAVERRVIATGVAEITASERIATQNGNRYFVRKPLKSDQGAIVGIEVHALNLEELDTSFQLLFSHGLQFEALINQSPNGIMVLRDGQTLFANNGWSGIFAELKEASVVKMLRNLLSEGGEPVQQATLNSRDGTPRPLVLHRSQIRWNGESATAVFCCVESAKHSASTMRDSTVSDNPASTAGVVLDNRGFVEKRRGRRREGSGSKLPSASTQNPDADLFAAIRHPVFVCANWMPLYANEAAQQLLVKNSGQRFDSVDGWFNDRAKAEVEAMQRARKKVYSPVPTSVVLKDKRYVASLSPINWAGRSAVLVSIQEVAATDRQIDSLAKEIRKLEDFAASAGDFFWEMDSEQRITQLSMEIKPMLGIPSKSLIGVPLETLIERYVLADDVAQWSVLTVDMRDHQPFRDREYKWLHRDGGKRVVRLSGVPVFGGNEEFLGYRGIGSDFTAEYNDASVVAYHASHDALTGLVNRREFESRCDEAIASARDGQSTHALCFLDLDKFKIVNDTCGHLAGDELLRQLAGLFAGLVRKSDVLARLGGDEFGVLVFDVGLNEALRLANQIRADVESYQFLWENRSFSVGASIGLVIVDDRWESRSAVFGAADAACYEAKNLGRNQVAVFKESESGSEANQGERQWAELLHSAIAERRIRLCMQKIIPLQSASQDHDMARIELCMRIQTREGEVIFPNAFLPAAERLGLCCELDRAVVGAALDWLGGQPHVADSMDLCSINISRQSFTDEEFIRFLLPALKAASFDISILCFEITESDAIANLSAATQFMKRVGELGCKFSLDHVGSGLSSFGYLKNLPITYVKIDGLFIRDILEDPIDFAMVKALNEIGQSLGKITIAEHVENEAVLDKVSEIGINLAQGFYIGKPEIIDF